MNLKSYLRGIGLGMIVTAGILHFSSGMPEKLTDMQIKARARELGMIDNDTLASVSDNSNTANDVNDYYFDKDSLFELQISDNEVAGNSELEKKLEKELEKKLNKLDNEDDKSVKSDTADDENKEISNKEASKKEDQTSIFNKDNSTDKSSTETKNNETKNDKKTDSKDDSTKSKLDKNENIENKSDDNKAEKNNDKDKKQTSDNNVKNENVSNNEVNENDVNNEIITISIVSGDSSYAAAKKVVAAGLRESAAAFDQFLCEHGYDKTLRVGTYKISKNATDDEIGKILNGK